MGVELKFNHADFRLLSRRVVEELRGCKESNLLLRGLIPQLGFPSALVYYDRHARFAGETKYPISKMISLAVNGITSFTAMPLKIITVLGMSHISIQLWAGRMGADSPSFSRCRRYPRLGFHRDSALYAGRNTTAMPWSYRAVSRQDVRGSEGQASIHRREELVVNRSAEAGTGYLRCEA
jgi:hypothetical protein